MRRRKNAGASSSPINFIAFAQMARRFAAEIPGIMERADRERLSVYLTQFQTEFPDFYAVCLEAVDFPAPLALAHIENYYPMATFLRYIPNIDAIIAAIQAQLRERKNNVKLLPSKS